MHNAAFRELGWEAWYTPCPVSRGNVGAAVAGLRALGFLGANVTVPHKEAVMPYLDEVDPLARQAGAVNTILCRDGRLSGSNTDVGGFLLSLEEAGFDPAGRGALLIGAGGAARGVALALVQAGAGPVWVAGRDPAKAAALCRDVAGAEPVAWDAAAVAAVAAGVGCLVNCTPVGMHGAAAATPPWEGWHGVFPRGGLAVDLIYNPERTPFLAWAEGQGLGTLGGLGMLVHQAALAWEVWFGRRGPAEIFYRAARTTLSSRGSGRLDAPPEGPLE